MLEEPRGIYFIDPEYGEYKETIKKRKKKPVGEALQKRNKEALRASGNWSEEWWIQQDSTNKACMHRGGSWVHEKAIGIMSTQAKDTIRCLITIWGHKIVPMPQTMKILDAKAAVDKERKKLETIPAWQLDKVKSNWCQLMLSRPLCHVVHALGVGSSESWVFSRTLDLCSSLPCCDPTSVESLDDRSLHELPIHTIPKKRRLFWKHKETKRKSTLLHWWTSVI